MNALSTEWPACATYPALGCVCRGALQPNKGTCTRKRTGDLTPIPTVQADRDADPVYDMSPGGFMEVAEDRDAGYQPCSHECNGCPACDPGLAPTDRDAGQVRLTENEERSLVGAAQRALVDGETGMANGDCNRAGWHVGEAIATTVESILAGRLAEVTAERSHAEFRLTEVASVAEERGYEVQAQRDRADTAEAALAARQSDPDATERVETIERVEWGVRATGIDLPATDEAAALRWVAMNSHVTVVRRTVTTGEWEEA